VDVGAGLVGLVAGLAAGPLLDRAASNAGRRAPLHAPVERSRSLPLVVLAATLLAGACGLAFGLTLESLVGALFCWALVVVTRTDLEQRIIPNRVVVPGTVLVLVGRTADDPSIEWAASAAGAGVALLVIVLVYPSGMGMGDVKLAAFLGAGLGIPAIVALAVGFFAAFVPALLLLLRHGRAARKRAIPLGPVHALGLDPRLVHGARRPRRGLRKLTSRHGRGRGRRIVARRPAAVTARSARRRTPRPRPRRSRRERGAGS
jgi:leader peptidase (prepilin peptidase)/N-methyltransferase